MLQWVPWFTKAYLHRQKLIPGHEILFKVWTLKSFFVKDFHVYVLVIKSCCSNYNVSLFSCFLWLWYFGWNKLPLLAAVTQHLTSAVLQLNKITHHFSLWEISFEDVWVAFQVWHELRESECWIWLNYSLYLRIVGCFYLLSVVTWYSSAVHCSTHKRLLVLSQFSNTDDNTWQKSLAVTKWFVQHFRTKTGFSAENMMTDL